MQKHLHVISFNIPDPPDYGGVIDVFYKLKALQEIGVHIYLHCFDYGRHHSNELKNVCKEVFYYKRSTSIHKHLSFLPYIVKSRASQKLIKMLEQDNHPILFEGVHTTYPLFSNKKFLKRTTLVRMHNIEWKYYDNLYQSESNRLRKLYFKLESNKLKNYEPVLCSAKHILSISPTDHTYLNLKYKNVTYLPIFHANKKIKSTEGKGQYLLYHGDLSVNENEKIVLWLIDNVFKKINHPVIIAGRQPSTNLINHIKNISTIKLKSDTNNTEMNALISNAHINIIPLSKPAIGMKVKLINALFNGRFCLTNNNMLTETGLDEFCIKANTSEEYIQQIDELFHKEFSSELIIQRKLIENTFSNIINATELARLIWA